MDDLGDALPISVCLRDPAPAPFLHLTILACVVGAVACSVGTQYGVKFLVDCLSAVSSHASNVWLAFAIFMLLIAADNLGGAPIGPLAGVIVRVFFAHRASP